VLIAEKKQKYHSSLQKDAQSIVEIATESIADINPNQTRIDYAYFVPIFSIFFLILFVLFLAKFSTFFDRSMWWAGWESNSQQVEMSPATSTPLIFFRPIARFRFSERSL